MSRQANVNFYDVEVYPNLFMVTLKTLAREGEPPPPEVYQIGFGKNDLLEIVRRFNNPNECFVGYNSFEYDDQIMNFLIANYYRLVKMGEEEICLLIQKQSNDIIVADNRDYKYRQYFKRIDLMRIIQVGQNKKSLKMVAVNLKWKKIQELPYEPNVPIPPDGVVTMLPYNLNDVDITEALFMNLRKQINMRSQIEHQYGVKVMSESDSGIANRLLDKLYADATGQEVWEFKKGRTYRTTMHMTDIIDPKIKFVSTGMKKFLAWLETESVEVKKKWEPTVGISDLGYQMAKGGLHSIHPEPKILESDDEYVLIDADVEGYYPTIMVLSEIKPEHVSSIFIPLLNQLKQQRSVSKKEAKNMDLTESERKMHQTISDALKIVVNSIYGKTGFIYHWLYDPLAMYRVTVNGQLFLLMLIDMLEHLGIQVVYANTDGITVRVKRGEMEALFMKTCSQWEKYTGFKLEFDRFRKFILRDVNNYIVLKEKATDKEIKKGFRHMTKNGLLKVKGVLDPFRYENLMKGFYAPVVPFSLYRYFVEGVPVEDTILGTTDVHEFCLAQKVDRKKFEAVMYTELDRDTFTESTEILQWANRYIVSPQGGTIYKRKDTGKIDVDGGAIMSDTLLVSGETVLIANDMEKLEQDWPDGIPIKRAWYIREAKKIIERFHTPQLDLFKS